MTNWERWVENNILKLERDILRISGRDNDISLPPELITTTITIAAEF